MNGSYASGFNPTAVTRATSFNPYSVTKTTNWTVGKSQNTATYNTVPV